MLDHLLSALTALRANKVRSALTMLGVIIGVLAVTLLVSVGDGRRETRGGFGPPMSNVAKPLTMDDVDALQRQSGLLRGVTGTVTGGGTVRYLGRERDTMVFGVGPAFSELRNMHVDTGTFVRDEDVTSRRRVAILGRTVVRELFGDENPLGKPIRVADGRFRVVGVMETHGASFGFDMDDMVFIPVTTAEDLFAQDHITQIVTAARSKDDVPQAMEEIDQILARRRNGEVNFTVQSQDDLMSAFGTLTTGLTWALLAIASVSLVVGGIGIMNIMLVSVRERTREIGVRRALGATRSDILWQFLIEAVALASVGGLLGMAMGLGIVTLVNRFVPALPLRFSPWIAGAAFVVGVVSGVVPARRAARLDPVDALRYE